MELDLLTVPVLVKSPSGAGYGTTNVEGEITISDIKPDIARILMYHSDVKGTNCEVKMGRVTVSGEIHAVVLYAATTHDQPVRSVSHMMPYSFDILMEGAMPKMHCETTVRVSSMDAKAMNARKIKVKIAVEGFARVFEKKSRHIVSDIQGIENVQTLKTSGVIPVFVGKAEDTFSTSGTVDLPTSSLPVWEVLMSKIALNNASITQTAGYAEVNGEVLTSVFYSEDDANGQLKRLDFSIPINGVIRVNELSDASDLKLNAKIVSQNVVATEDDTGELKSFKVDLEVMASVEGYTNQELEMIEDAFAPGVAMTVQKSEMMLEDEKVIANGGFSINTSIGIDENTPAIANVVLTDCKVKESQISFEDSKAVIRGTLDVRVLYNGEEESGVRGVSHEVPFEREVDLPTDEICNNLTLKVDIGECSCTASTIRTLEPRIEVSFEVQAIQATPYSITENIASEGVQSGIDNSDDVVVFIARGGETVWDIAKKHLVTLEEVVGIDGMPLQSTLAQGDKVIIF